MARFKIVLVCMLMCGLLSACSSTESYNHEKDEALRNSFVDSAEQLSEEFGEFTPLENYQFGGSGWFRFKETQPEDDTILTVDDFESEGIESTSTGGAESTSTGGAESTSTESADSRMLESYKSVHNDAVTDEELANYVYVDKAFMIWGLEKQLTRASLLVHYGNTSLLKDFTLTISFYNKKGKLLNTVKSDTMDFPGWLLTKVKFDCPSECTYFSIDNLEFSNEIDCTNKTDYLYHSFNEEFKSSGLEISLNKESANYFTGRLSRKANVFFIDKNNVCIDSTVLEDKFVYTSDFGACKYEFCIMED